MAERKSLEERAEKLEIRNDVRPLIVDSACAYGKPSEGICVLQSSEYNIISLEESAQLTMQERFAGKYLVKEAFLAIPSKGLFITRNPVFLGDPERLSDSSYFFISPKEEVDALKDSVFIGEYSSQVTHSSYREYARQFPLRKGNIDFSKDPIMQFCFKKSIEKFESFLLSDSEVQEFRLYCHPKGLPKHGNLSYISPILFDSKEINESSGGLSCHPAFYISTFPDWWDTNNVSVRGVKK